MADKQKAPPKVGPEVFAHNVRAGNERKAAEAAQKQKAPPKVGPEIFTQPNALAATAGEPVKKPVGAEVFSAKQLEGIVPNPITSPAAEKAPVRAGDTKGRKVAGAGDSKTAAKTASAKPSRTAPPRAAKAKTSAPKAAPTTPSAPSPSPTTSAVKE